MQLVNLTPHPLKFVTLQGVVDLQQSGQIARVRTSVEEAGNAAGIPVFTSSFGQVEGLPAPQPDTIYIVSSLVQQALRANGVDRPDVLSPGTGPNDSPIRENGQIVAVTRLVRVAA